MFSNFNTFFLEDREKGCARKSSVTSDTHGAAAVNAVSEGTERTEAHVRCSFELKDHLV